MAPLAAEKVTIPMILTQREATRTSNASRVMFIEKKETVVPVGATKATFTYNLDQALNVWNCPLPSCAPNNLTTINMGKINLEVVYE
jgi:hypothetical protein